MIIELCGLPGTGKTTLAAELARTRQYKLVQLNGKIRVMYYLLKGFLKQPRLYCGGLRWCLRHNVHRYYTWNFFCFRYAKLQKALDMNAADKNDVIVLDEGPLLNLVSYSNHIHDENELGYFRSYAASIELFVFISITESERRTQVAKRNAVRPHSPIQSDEKREWHMHENVAYVEAICREHPGGRIITSMAELGSDLVCDVQSNV